MNLDEALRECEPPPLIDHDPDRYQNLITWSLYHHVPLLKISLQFIHNI